jgi:hypothetical protein
VLTNIIPRECGFLIVSREKKIETAGTISIGDVVHAAFGFTGWGADNLVSVCPAPVLDQLGRRAPTESFVSA